MSAQGAGGEKLPQEPFVSGPRQGNRTGRFSLPSTPQEMEAARRRLRTRNIATGFLIGAFIIGVYSYTFHAISQETFLDDLEGEAAALRAKAAQTSGTDRAPDGNAQG